MLKKRDAAGRNKPAGQVFRIGAGGHNSLRTSSIPRIAGVAELLFPGHALVPRTLPPHYCHGGFMEALGLLFVGTTLLLLVTQAAESFGAGLPLNRSLETGLRLLAARRPLDRTRLAIVAVE